MSGTRGFSLTTIVASDYPMNLHILKGRLEAEGIPAFIADEEVVTMNWLYSTALGGVRLQVWRQDAERAAEILGLDWREEELIDEDDIEGEEEPVEGLALGQESDEGRETAAEESTESDLNAPLTLEELSTLAKGCTPDQDAVTTDSAPGDELIRCPECSSTKISYQKYRQRLVFGAWLLLGFPLPLTKRRWQCEACGHEWRAHP